ncbi:hypothetical protein KP509_03G067600 [Ceratopteris richardii]|uniref:Uncharacterized protein n=1 Tax=Ceratopteris richardii TaxID=49495 RepID=A0A8T2V7R2_CERRI|nr:hypothetical protein KP509_03G067600 [Ceratopteris richardii]
MNIRSGVHVPKKLPYISSIRLYLFAGLRASFRTQVIFLRYLVNPRVLFSILMPPEHKNNYVLLMGTLHPTRNQVLNECSILS